MFKDEVGGRQITEFVGQRAKLYSFVTEEGDEEKKCKGVKKSVVRKEISFSDYKDCLFGEKSQNRSMKSIRSGNHDIYLEEVNKVALSREDDKRYILPNGVDTLALGHDWIPQV